MIQKCQYIRGPPIPVNSAHCSFFALNKLKLRKGDTGTRGANPLIDKTRLLVKRVFCSNSRKMNKTMQNRVPVTKVMEFFTSAIDTLKTLVIALGAGLGVWGVINLLESYGNDNPGAKSQGMKQLMAGGGVALIGFTLIPMLANLFS